MINSCIFPEYEGIIYSILWVILLFSIAYSLSFLIEKLHKKYAMKMKYKKMVIIIFSIIIIIGIVLTAVDFSYKNTLPNASCGEKNYNNGVYIKCENFLDWSEKTMLMNYYIENTGENDKICSTFISPNFKMQDDIIIKSHEKISSIDYLLAYPERDVILNLYAECEDIK